MPAVTIRDGLSYGFSLWGHLLAVVLVGLVPLPIAAVAAQQNVVLGVAVGALLAIPTWLAGGAALGYKVVADAVAAGTAAAD